MRGVSRLMTRIAEIVAVVLDALRSETLTNAYNAHGDARKLRRLVADRGEAAPYC